MKKRFNKNIIVFVFFIIFVISGINGSFFEKLRWNIIDVAAQIKHFDFISARDLLDKVSVTASEELNYHDCLMDINSLKENIVGTRIIKKDEETTIIKSNSGSLVGAADVEFSDKDVSDVVLRFKGLKEKSDSVGAKFLYAAAPVKANFETLPENAENKADTNLDKLMKYLEENQIPFLNLKEVIQEKQIPQKDIFYDTDHHWRAMTGFAVNSAICETLHKKYGAEYDIQKTLIDNYQIKTYFDWSLGSSGKKVGKYFSWNGLDDFEIITPIFSTSFSLIQSQDQQYRNGKFEDTIIYKEYVSQKDPYRIVNYRAYCGGDYRKMIVKNNHGGSLGRVLMVKDSFANVVSPFLALQANETHIIDTRGFISEDKLSVYDYIEEIKPNYVIVLYSGLTKLNYSEGKYDFDFDISCKK